MICDRYLYDLNLEIEDSEKYHIFEKEMILSTKLPFNVSFSLIYKFSLQQLTCLSTLEFIFSNPMTIFYDDF